MQSRRDSVSLSMQTGKHCRTCAWNTGSTPLQLQMPPSLELLKSGMCPWRAMGAPACGTGFPREKRSPFWVKADLFVRSLQSKDLQSVFVFLVRARSFSHFLHGFLFDLFCIFMFVLFSVVPRSVWRESCLEICVAQALFVKIFLQIVAAIVLENVTFFRHEKFF